MALPCIFLFFFFFFKCSCFRFLFSFQKSFKQNIFCKFFSFLSCFFFLLVGTFLPRLLIFRAVCLSKCNRSLFCFKLFSHALKFHRNFSTKTGKALPLDIVWQYVKFYLTLVSRSERIFKFFHIFVWLVVKFKLFIHIMASLSLESVIKVLKLKLFRTLSLNLRKLETKMYFYQIFRIAFDDLFNTFCISSIRLLLKSKFIISTSFHIAFNHALSFKNIKTATTLHYERKR